MPQDFGFVPDNADTNFGFVPDNVAQSSAASAPLSPQENMTEAAAMFPEAASFIQPQAEAQANIPSPSEAQHVLNYAKAQGYPFQKPSMSIMKSGELDHQGIIEAIGLSDKYNIPLPTAYNLLQPRLSPAVAERRKSLGLPENPTVREKVSLLMETAFIPPIAIGLITAPVATALGLGVYQAVSELESKAVNLIKGEKYQMFQNKGLAELMPEDTSDITLALLDVFDVFAKGAVTGGVLKGGAKLRESAPRLFERLTKDVINTYNLPRKVYLSGQDLTDIHNGLKTDDLAEFYKEAGIPGKQAAEAIRTGKGLDITLDAEKITTIRDKAWWVKVKSLFKLDPSQEKISVSRVGGKAETPVGALPAGETTPKTPPAEPAMPPEATAKLDALETTLQTQDVPEAELAQAFDKAIGETLTSPHSEPPTTPVAPSVAEGQAKLPPEPKQGVNANLSGEIGGIDALPAEERAAHAKMVEAAVQHVVDKAPGIVPEMIDRLKAAGYDETSAKIYATTYGGLKNMIDASGMSPEEADAFIQENLPSITRMAEANPAEGLTGEGYSQSAYHGTPHKFDKFTLEHIGKGEGAQVYGWGLYFAENKDVAAWYKNKLSKDHGLQLYYKGKLFTATSEELASDITQIALNDIRAFGGKTLAINFITKVHLENKGASEFTKERARKAIKAIEAIDEKDIRFEEPGRLYKVNLPEKDDFLDWDKPLSEQSEKIKKALEPLRERYRQTEGVKGLYTSDTDSGRDIYNALISDFQQGRKEPIVRTIHGGYVGDQNASLYLKSIGIPGIKYLEGVSRDKGEGKHNFVIFDEELIKIEEYYQKKGETPRGRISFGKNGIDITLLEKADPSTFLHETGHLYFKLMGELAAMPKATEELKGNYKTILDWLGAEKGKPLTVTQHEKFARGLEVYFMEGKAPSKELETIFAKIKEWLRGVYKTILELGVELTPEVRRVMDSIFATPEERAAMKAAETARAAAEPTYEPAKKTGVKTLIREATGQTKDMAAPISELGQLKAAYIKAARAAREAYRAGNKEGAAVEKARMSEILNAAKEKTGLNAAIKKLKTTAEKLSDSSAVAADYRNKIKDVIGRYELSGHTAGILEELQATQEYLKQSEAAGENIELPRRVLEKLKILSRVPKNELTRSQVEGLQAEIELLGKLGKTKWSSKEALYDAEKADRQKTLLETATPINTKAAGVAPIGEKPKAWVERYVALRNFMQKNSVALTPIDGLADITGMKPMKAALDLGFGNYLTFNDLALSRWQEATAGFKDGSFERLGAKLLEKREGGVQRLANSGITQEALNAVKLTPKEEKAAILFRTLIEEHYADVKKFMLDNYNIALPDIDNYVSFHSDYDALNELEMYDRFGSRPDDAIYRTKTVEQGFTKAAAAKSKIKLELNANKILQRHLDDVAYMLTLGRDIKQYSEIVNTPEMRAKLGDVGSLAWLQWLDVMARKGGSEGAKRIAALDIVRRNMGSGVLAFRIASALVQPSTFADTIGTIGVKWATRGAYEIATSKAARNFVIDNFPEVKKAVGDDIAFRELGDGYITHIGMTGLTALDGLMRSTAAIGAYHKAAFEKGVVPDYTKPDAGLLAGATKAMRESQGSSFFKDQPLAMTAGYGLSGNKSLNKTILLFQSFMLHRWDNIERQIWRLGIKEKNYKKAASSFFWIVIVAAALEEGIRRGVRKGVNTLTGDDREEDSFATGAALNIVQAVPIAGQVVSSLTYSSNPIPLINTSEDIIKGTAGAFKGQDRNTKVKGVIRAAGAVGTLSGIPGSSQAAQILGKAVSKKKVKK